MPYTQDGLPYVSDSETSHDAAIRAAAFVGEQGLIVLRWFQDRGSMGGTQKEASAALGIGRPSICARTRALELAGQIRKRTDRRDGSAVYQVKEER